MKDKNVNVPHFQTFEYANCMCDVQFQRLGSEWNLA